MLSTTCITTQVVHLTDAMYISTSQLSIGDRLTEVQRLFRKCCDSSTLVLLSAPCCIVLCIAYIIGVVCWLIINTCINGICLNETLKALPNTSLMFIVELMPTQIQ